jgi:hypothetical protein
VNRKLPQAVVRYLSLADERSNADKLCGFKARDWQNAFMWLDNAGLTLYLLRRLQVLDATEILPPNVLARFERNLSDNRLRVEEVAKETARINQEFERKGVKYAIVKGLSLVPAYCPDAYLRTQCDLDYLVDQQSLVSAQTSLKACGYEARGASEVQFNFGKPLRRVPSRFDDPYSSLTDPMVELHVSMCRRMVSHSMSWNFTWRMQPRSSGMVCVSQLFQMRTRSYCRCCTCFSIFSDVG